MIKLVQAGDPTGKRPLVRPRARREDQIKKDSKKGYSQDCIGENSESLGVKFVCQSGLKGRRREKQKIRHTLISEDTSLEAVRSSAILGEYTSVRSEHTHVIVDGFITRRTNCNARGHASISCTHHATIVHRRAAVSSKTQIFKSTRYVRHRALCVTFGGRFVHVLCPPRKRSVNSRRA